MSKNGIITITIFLGLYLHINLRNKSKVNMALIARCFYSPTQTTSATKLKQMICTITRE